MTLIVNSMFVPHLADELEAFSLMFYAMFAYIV